MLPIPVVSTALFVTLLAVVACNGEPEKSGTGGAPASVYANMLRMEVPWQGILKAQREEDWGRVAGFAKELRRLGRETAFTAGRDETVWRKYVRAYEEGVTALAAAGDAASTRAGIRKLELSCNECHRRYQ